MDRSEPYVQTIRSTYPDLAIESVELIDQGQNSVVLVVDGTWIYRFPRYAHVLARLRVETAVLQAIQDRVPLVVPVPVYLHLEEQEPERSFVGYRRISGEPLWRDTFRPIENEATINTLAHQLAGFLWALHSVPPAAIPAQLVRSDTRAEWRDIYARMVERLFPHMRPDARAWTAAHFETYLEDETAFAYEPVLRHGDFGPSNILYERTAGQITGILDFGNSGLGDPAYDFAGLLSGYGEDFVQRCAHTYPQVEEFLPRIRFYRGTFALLEALFGAENDDPAAFAAGMASYI